MLNYWYSMKPYPYLFFLSSL